jgi:hypothetical protein
MERIFRVAAHAKIQPILRRVHINQSRLFCKIYPKIPQAMTGGQVVERGIKVDKFFFLAIKRSYHGN